MPWLNAELFACISVHRPLFPLHQLKGNLETMLGGCIDSTFEKGLGKHSVRFFSLLSLGECVSLITVYSSMRNLKLIFLDDF